MNISIFRMLIVWSFICSVDAAEVEVCFTTERDCRQEIIKEIDNATAEILVQSYIFTDEELAKALIQAYNRHINVLVIYDKHYLGKKGDKIAQLEKAGILTMADATSGIAHSKVMVIDRNITLTGSYNFSDAARTRNVENLVVTLSLKRLTGGRRV